METLNGKMARNININLKTKLFRPLFQKQTSGPYYEIFKNKIRIVYCTCCGLYW
jgi:hypothetical protein